MGEPLQPPCRRPQGTCRAGGCARADQGGAGRWSGELIFTSGASEAALLAFDNATVIDEVISCRRTRCGSRQFEQRIAAFR